MTSYNMDELIKAKDHQLDALNRVIDLLGKKRLPVYISVNKEDPASVCYTNIKKRMFDKYGFETHLVDSLSLFSDEILRASAMVQLPHPNKEEEIRQIQYAANDVDCMHEWSLGGMFDCKYPLNSKVSPPATVKAVLDIISDYFNNDVNNIRGKRVMIVGKSNIIGKPLALILGNLGATVTIFGRDEAFKEDFFKCVDQDVIVLATNSQEVPLLDSKDLNYAFHGLLVDVGFFVDLDGNAHGDFDSLGCDDLTFTYTPVPGGVGPMTVRNLIENHMLFCIGNWR